MQKSSQRYAIHIVESYSGTKIINVGASGQVMVGMIRYLWLRSSQTFSSKTVLLNILNSLPVSSSLCFLKSRMYLQESSTVRKNIPHMSVFVSICILPSSGCNYLTLCKQKKKTGNKFGTWLELSHDTRTILLVALLHTSSVFLSPSTDVLQLIWLTSLNPDVSWRLEYRPQVTGGNSNGKLHAL